jgi:branched-chain amino acid transport system substrate-binding protein
VTDSWAFLVARGRRASYRTVLAPDFLVARGLHVVLAESLQGSGVVAGEVRMVTLPAAGAEQATAHYTVQRVTRADVNGAGQGDELLTDEHGRPLEMLYGVVTLGPQSKALAEDDLRTARVQALASYGRFLANEDDFTVDRSIAEVLRGSRAAPATVTHPTATPGQPTIESATPELHRPGAGARYEPERLTAGRSGRRVHVRYGLAAAFGVLLLVLGAACMALRGNDEVVIYASLPFQGPLRERALDMDRAMRLALTQAGGRAGDFDVRYRPLDDSRAGERGWTPAAVAQNATRAADDDRTAAYIGDFNSGATAISILILSGKRVAQISPSSTAVGLTSDGPGAGKGEPDRYYQNGFRNFVRVVPKDTVQAAALAAIMTADGCRRVGIVDDRGVYGAGLARNVKQAVRRHGLGIVFSESVGAQPADTYGAQAERAARLHVDCFMFSGDTRSNATAVFEAMASRLPATARLYGGDGVSDTGFTDVERGGVSHRVAERVQLTIPTIGPPGLGAAGRRFSSDFADAYPDHTNPDPYAIYAYESMRLALDAIRRSGSGKREDVVKALFATRDRRSVIGRYSINKRGDTTIRAYGRFDIHDGRPRLVARIQG